MAVKTQTLVKALAAEGPGKKLSHFEYTIDEIGESDVLVEVTACGICHSDLSMWQNDWKLTQYPFVPGHEIVGRVAAVGEKVTHLRQGQMVGVGWMAKSCMSCSECMQGDHNLCGNHQATIVGRHGGFASAVLCSSEWVLPLPDGLNVKKIAPLLCGGITVFNPLIQFGVKPTDRVGVIGIGGLGHMALQMLGKWGCEVTAFSHTSEKRDEAIAMGAHRLLDSRDKRALRPYYGYFDFILSTVNVTLEWEEYFSLLSPKGRLHTVGAVAEPIEVAAFSLISGQKSLSGTPIGAPYWMGKMLEFCARHKIEPIVEYFPLSAANEAFEHLKAGKARYRIVLENDLK